MRAQRWAASGLLAWAVAVGTFEAQAAATFVLHAEGAGFKDPTPVEPVGGNPGKTLGEQRRLAVEHALDIWSEVLTSSVPIEISVTFDVLDNCNGGSVVLGQASPASVAQTSNPNAGGGNFWHPIALANAIEGEDLDPGNVDIVAEFNSAIDNNCLRGVKWYYGFDGQAGRDEDFVSTVLHEIAHGLGFASFVSENGGYFGNAPDIYSYFAFDLSAQKRWDQMSAAERRNSSVNPRGLVWNGPNVKAQSANFLDLGSPTLSVSPAVPGLSGRLSEQVLGPRLPAGGITGKLVVANPIHGCAAPSNAAQIKGNVVLVDSAQKSNCSPMQAQVYMELAGAAAVLSVEPPWDGVVGSDPPTPIYGSYGPDFPEPQKVPIFAITYEDSLRLRDAAGATVTLSPSNQLVGADPSGRPYLFATDPYQRGSSVSHWDTFARKNLLMEPTATPDAEGTDITRYFMQDIGWSICGDGVKEGAEECDDGNAVAMDGCSPSCKPEVCGDGEINQKSEECDDGNTEAGDGCGPTCKLEVCGDGVVNQKSEECDDGNTKDGDGCSSKCIVERCGDGVVNQKSEECDDGNTTNGDGCESDCTFTPGHEPGDGSGGATSGGSGGNAGRGGRGSGTSSSGSDSGGNREVANVTCQCDVVGKSGGSTGAFGWLGAALALVGVRRRVASRARAQRA